LFGGVEASDAPLELPIQAAITVLPTAETTHQDAGRPRHHTHPILAWLHCCKAVDIAFCTSSF